MVMPEWHPLAGLGNEHFPTMQGLRVLLSELRILHLSFEENQSTYFIELKEGVFGGLHLQRYLVVSFKTPGQI